MKFTADRRACELAEILRPTDQHSLEDLMSRAYSTRMEYAGRGVHVRGLIELSNICKKDCYYCGIRHSNDRVDRYIMAKQEVLEAAKWAYDFGLGSIVLQAGERTDEPFIALVEDILSSIRCMTGGRLVVTLSLGEQRATTYRRWRDAGAERYLLRIETSRPELYARLHPQDHSWYHRRDCLRLLRDIGYQVGTGVMIGLPGQSVLDLANDILFFEREGVPMIGMGPYVPHSQTPLGGRIPRSEETAVVEDVSLPKERTEIHRQSRAQLELALQMIAATRLYLRNVNIASTTALLALDADGRDLGILAGANVVMPNITPITYRSRYSLYDGKPCSGDSPAVTVQTLDARLTALGERIGYHQRGDSRAWLENRDTANFSAC